MSLNRRVQIALRLTGMLAVIGGLAVVLLASTRTGTLIGGGIVVVGGLLAHWVRRAAARKQ
jgi:hypothetical protein